MSGYATVVNAMHPVTPKAVGGPSRSGGTRSATPELPSRAPMKQPRNGRRTPHEQLVAFANRHLTEAQLIVLTRRLEKHHQHEPRSGRWRQRLADLVYWSLPHETAQKYLDELQRGKDNGESLTQG
jgi:hypothetical protein